MSVFFFKEFSPLFEGMCELHPLFVVYSMSCVMGLLGTVVSMFATICVVNRCSGDGQNSTPTDFAAIHLQRLYESNPGYAQPGMNVKSQPQQGGLPCSIL